MFELEIMVTGYTIVVVSTTVIITKYFGKKQINNIRLELNAVKYALQKAEAEVIKLKTQSLS